MIVNYKQSGWQVITQRAHGIVAAQLAFQWRVKERPSRWVETLLAIAEHDDAENELDGENLLTEAGGPLNFAMKRFELPHLEKMALMTATKSRYISLLTSLHMCYLYEKDQGDIPGATTFLQEQKKLQELWRKELDLSKEAVAKAYDLLEWCDALSLLICKGDLQPEQRCMEISAGPDKNRHQLVQVDATTLAVNPWPFEANSFTISYETRLIPQIQFASSAAFREAFLAAEIQTQTWQLVKQKTKQPKKVKVK